jgi:hypothetical protein
MVMCPSSKMTFDDFNPGHTVLAAHTLSLPEAVVLPVPMEPSASVLPVATNVYHVSPLQDPSVSFSSGLTGAGLLLLCMHCCLVKFACPDFETDY